MAVAAPLVSMSTRRGNWDANLLTRPTIACKLGSTMEDVHMTPDEDIFSAAEPVTHPVDEPPHGSDAPIKDDEPAKDVEPVEPAKSADEPAASDQPADVHPEPQPSDAPVEPGEPGDAPKDAPATPAEPEVPPSQPDPQVPPPAAEPAKDPEVEAKDEALHQAFLHVLRTLRSLAEAIKNDGSAYSSSAKEAHIWCLGFVGKAESAPNGQTGA